MSHTRSSLMATVLVAAVCVVCLRGVVQVFVPAPSTPLDAVALRGAPAVLAASAASLPLAASAADPYLAYNFAGEYTPFMTIGYFGLTGGMTVVAFLSYLVLTKLKII
eukprot:TRINITY_DN114722_c0_g1_i1.p1 TRINITY_DN114722_c0_g1~~TRINITY_DN114722_c0_g1_i1.p1  ORF type:complete len:108 (-),score=22.35 TRINITY_DN114722_c0_g1_i1:102-425(-)